MITEINLTGNETDAELEQAAFEMFALAHPHEAHETWPDRFWEFFHRQRPDLTRLKMEQMLGVK